MAERDDQKGEELVEKAESLLDHITKRIRQLRSRLGIPHEPRSTGRIEGDSKSDCPDRKNRRILRATLAPQGEGLVAVAHAGYSSPLGYCEGRVAELDGHPAGSD